MLDGITSALVTQWTNADNVAFSPSLTSGTKLRTITINGTATDLYCQTNTVTDTDSNITSTKHAERQRTKRVNLLAFQHKSKSPLMTLTSKGAQKAIAENKLYKGGKSYSSFLAVMGAPSVAGEENGNFGLYHYEQGADKSIKDNKTVFTPAGDLYNNILALEEDTSAKIGLN